MKTGNNIVYSRRKKSSRKQNMEPGSNNLPEAFSRSENPNNPSPSQSFSTTLTRKTHWEYADGRNPELQTHKKNKQTSATLSCKTQCNCDIQSSISWALTRPVQCAEQVLELKICVYIVSRGRHTDSCERVHPLKHKCASLYSAAHSQMWQRAFCYSGVGKMNLSTIGRPASRKTPKKIVLLEFLGIDTTFSTRGLPTSKYALNGYVLKRYVWDDAYWYAWYDIDKQSSEEPCDETSFGKNITHFLSTLRKDINIPPPGVLENMFSFSNSRNTIHLCKI